MSEDSRYCVYVHKDLDGCIFYVGSGTVERAFTKELSVTSGMGTGRGLRYSDKVKSLNFKYDVVIIQSGLSKRESIDIEKNLILQQKELLNNTLVNYRTPSNVMLLDKEYLSEYVYTCSSSPSGIRWKIDMYSGRGKGYVIKEKGSVAGSRSSKDYWEVRINNISYKVHRVILTLHGFDLADKVVDHIDGDSFNNFCENLRIVSTSGNSRNTKMKSNNKTGIVGVRRLVQIQSSGKVDTYWSAQYVDEHGITHKKRFNVVKYGEDTSKQLAINYRICGIFSVNAALAALGDTIYSDRHIGDILNGV